MLSSALSLAVLILGAASALCVLYFLLGYERKEKRAGFIIAFSCVVLINIAAEIFIKDSEITELVKELSLSASVIFLPYLLLKSQKRLTFFLFGVVFCSTLDYIESLIIYFFRKPTAIHEQIIYISLYSVVLLCVFVLYKIKGVRIPSGFLEQLSPAVYAVIFIADLSAYYDVMLDKDSSYYSGVSIVLKILSTALIVGCFSYIVYLCSGFSRKQKEAELQLSAELKHYEEMVRKNEDIRAFRHDYKNNLYSIKALAAAGKCEDVVNFVSGLNDELKLSDNRYKTGNYLADAIISEKAGQAEKSEITVEFSGVIPDTGIENNDLCAILSNALDNAVRACEEIAPRRIKIHSELTANGITIKFINPVKENVQIKNNSIKSTKSDKANNGFGIANIKKAVRKYDGYVELKCENRMFCLEAGLVLK